MKQILSLSLATLTFLFTSCNNSNEQNSNIENPDVETISIQHSLGTAEIVKNPQRVVALDFGSVETLDELGIEIVGMPKASIPSHLEKFKNNAEIVDLGTLKEVDYEKLNELNPDLIFTSGRLQNDYPEMSKIAPAIYTEIDYTDYIHSLKSNLDIYAKIFDVEEKTDLAYQKIEDKINDIRTKAEESDKRALIILHNNGRFSAYGKGSRFGMIHDVLGLKEAVENLEVARHGQSVSNEFIQEANPDYLFIIDRSAVVDREMTNKAEIENKLIQQTNAYKEGKIIYLDAEIWYLSGGGITSINKMLDEIAESL